MAYVINYEEVNTMPGRNGTGPMGAGSMTGRGLGACTGVNAVGYGYGRGMGYGRGLFCRRGYGRGFGRGASIYETSPKTQKELLDEQKRILQDRLEYIDKQLENL
jgi:hypothetical protein